jgi:CubicO group peptidase (beta-lactamase class C family)
MSPKIVRVILPMLFPFLFYGCSSLPSHFHPAKGDYASVKKHLAEFIQKEMNKNQVQGLSIALVDDQTVVWAQGFGFADKAKKLAATPETIYRIGSISKSVTATAIMKLVEEGKLDLDKPIAEYIPDFSIHSRFGPSKPITTRSLLAHHAGLPTEYSNAMWVEHPVSLAQLVKDLQSDYLASPPQALYKYSNFGYSLLGRELELITKKDFETALQEMLLKPLGMAASTYAWPGSNAPSNYSKGYRNGQEAYISNLRDNSAGSMCSNVLDMSRFLKFIFSQGNVAGKQVLKAETMQQLLTPQYPGLELDFGHELSLAWMLTGYTVTENERVAWHDGGYPPFHAHLSFLPDQRLGVVILANSQAKSIDAIGIKALQLAYEAKTGKPVIEPAPGFKPQTATPEELEHDAGNYLMMGQKISVRRQGGILKTSLWSHDLDLIPVEKNQFVPQFPFLWGLFAFPLPYQLEFKTVQGIELLQLKGLPGRFVFEKIQPKAIPGTWQKRLGAYECINNREDLVYESFTLEIEDQVLTAKTIQSNRLSGTHNLPSKIVLQPFSDTEAVAIGLGEGEGETLGVYSDQGQEELFYSGFRFRRKH